MKTASALAVLFLCTSTYAGRLKCSATKYGWDAKPPMYFGVVTSTVEDVPTKVPSNSAPGTLEARPVFTIDDYEVKLVVRIGTKDDDSLWYRYTVYKIEDGLRRGIGNGMEGSTTATEAARNIACVLDGSTTCLSGSTGNVDMDTILGNLEEDLSPAEGYARGIVPKELPASFGVFCSWYK